MDLRPWPTSPRGVELHRVDLRKRAFEDLMRKFRPDIAVHMGFVRDLSTDAARRHDVNVRGTRRFLDLCARCQVPQVAVMSTGTVYGAHPENPYRIDEGAELLASRSYPEIRDLVEVDGLATRFLWQHPEVVTSVLRPVNVLGPHSLSFASRYLRQDRVPTVLGFDPMMQFIHELDVARAIQVAAESGVRGVFNVVGPGEVPVSVAIAESGGRSLPLPDFLLRSRYGGLFRGSSRAYPPGLLDFLKYPVTLSGSAFYAATKFEPEHSLRDIFETMRRERRVRSR